MAARELSGKAMDSINFTENQLGCAILDKLRAQKEVGQFCDITFHVQQKEYLAHRNVLAACSPYFESLLKFNKVPKEQIVVECKDHSVFEILLDYMYTGKIVIHRAIVEELLKLANRFMISKLKEYCCEYLERNLDMTNCFVTKSIAMSNNLQVLRLRCESFILTNIMHIVEEKEVLEFTDKRLTDLVSNKTMPMTEEVKLHLICRWLAHCLDDRQVKFQFLLGLIQWEKCNMPVVYTILRDNPLFQTSDLCLLVMLMKLKAHGCLFSVYNNTLKCLLEKHAKDAEEELNNIASLQTSMADSNSCLEKDMGKSLSAQVAGTALEGRDTGVDLPTSDLSVMDYDVSKHGLKPDKSCDKYNRSINETLKHTFHNDTMVEEGLLSQEVPEAFGESDDSNLMMQDLDTAMALPCCSPAPSTEGSSLAKGACDFDVALGPVSLLNQSWTQPPQVDTPDKPRKEKHKRKGIPKKIKPEPVMLRIPKSKLKLDVKFPRKRGRPPKVTYKKESLKKDGAVQRPKGSRKAAAQGQKQRRASADTDVTRGADVSLDACRDVEPVQYRPQDDGSLDNGQKEAKKMAKLKCNECQYETCRPSKLDEHREKAHKDDTVYSCSICDFRSYWNREYYNHMKIHFVGPPFMCDFSCGYTADRIQQLLYHRMRHTDERPYECTICNLRFRSKNNLATHQRCHTGEKPFSCEHCGRSFATKGTLEQHGVTHSDIRPYLCDLCGFSTKYQSHLIAHKRIHSGDVFKCQYSGCNYSTPKRSQLACHMRTHMSIRSHICSVCGRGFVEKGHLVRHERIHMDDKPFKCHVCDYVSSRRDKLKEHEMKYHGESTSPGKAPYKARRARRQTYDPAAFPLLTAEQAQAQIEGMMLAAETTLTHARAAGVGADHEEDDAASAGGHGAHEVAPPVASAESGAVVGCMVSGQQHFFAGDDGMLDCGIAGKGIPGERDLDTNAAGALRTSHHGDGTDMTSQGADRTHSFLRQHILRQTLSSVGAMPTTAVSSGLAFVPLSQSSLMSDRSSQLTPTPTSASPTLAATATAAAAAPALTPTALDSRALTALMEGRHHGVSPLVIAPSHHGVMLVPSDPDVTSPPTGDLGATSGGAHQAALLPVPVSQQVAQRSTPSIPQHDATDFISLQSLMSIF